MIRQEDFGRLRRFDGPRSAPDRPVRRAVPPTPQPESAPTPEETRPLPVTAPVQINEPRRLQAGRKWRPSRRQWALSGLTCLLLAGGAGGFVIFSQSADASPIPSSYKSAVDYPVYYPDPSKLPANYHLNTNSFSTPAKGIILYTLSGKSGTVLNVSLQDKPSASNLKAFNSQRIPLHTTVDTPVGQAVVGAIGNQSVVSLPTSSKTWIIVTAPYDIDQSQLDQVLKSFKN